MNMQEQKYESIIDVLNYCGSELALVSVDNSNSTDHLQEWLDTLAWALYMLPEGYESTRAHIKSEIRSTEEIIDARLKRLKYQESLDRLSDYTKKEMEVIS